MTYDLDRFVTAQNAGGSHDSALAELRRGRKTSHWMWFVFPQVAGLGRSAMAQRYAVAGLAQARAYLHHPILGPRLVQAAQAVLDSGAPDATTLLGGVDALKLHSSMTLFEAAASSAADTPADSPAGPAAGSADGAEVFTAVLARYYAGQPDPETLRRL